MTRHATAGILPLLVTASMLLTACSDGTPGAAPQESQTTSSAGATDGARDAQPPWELLEEEPEGVAVPAGAYGLTVNGVSDLVVVVQAPDGYQQLGGWTFLTGEPFGTGEQFRAMGFFTADGVPRDPCGTGWDSSWEAVDPGPTVEDLAEALVAQKGAVTSKPVPVTVDGHHGLYLTYQVAKSIDVPACDAHGFYIFSTGPGAWYLEASRERAAIWILDVDGKRHVLGWIAVPGVTRAQMREMTRMVQSARFVEP